MRDNDLVAEISIWTLTQLLIHKLEAIRPIPDSMIPVDFCQKNKPVFNFSTDNMTPKFEVFSKNKMYALNLTEIIQIDWLQLLIEY